jgi:hypothetical protein
MPKSRSDGFFMGVSSIGKVLSLKSNVNAQKSPIDNTLVYGDHPNFSPPPGDWQRSLHGLANTELLRPGKRSFLNEIRPDSTSATLFRKKIFQRERRLWGCGLLVIRC